MSKYNEVSKEVFSNEILRWIGQDCYPLEMIKLFKHFDDYLPTIPKFAPAATEEITLILGGSYPSRKAALSVVAELWDKAEESIGVNCGS